MKNLTIDVKTTVGYSELHTSEVFPFQFIESFLSELIFSKPVKAGEKEHSKLILKTVWKDPSCPRWVTSVCDGGGSVLGHERSFENLHEPFENYTPDRLKKWYENAFQVHQSLTRKIQDFYFRCRGDIQSVDYLIFD